MQHSSNTASLLSHGHVMKCFRMLCYFVLKLYYHLRCVFTYYTSFWQIYVAERTILSLKHHTIRTDTHELSNELTADTGAPNQSAHSLTHGRVSARVVHHASTFAYSSSTAMSFMHISYCMRADRLTLSIYECHHDNNFKTCTHTFSFHLLSPVPVLKY
jgi:hypothetical protein